MSTTVPTSAGRKVIVWFRNDLRITDNPVLNYAASLLTSSSTSSQKAPKATTVPATNTGVGQGNILCLYCFDPRHYTTTPYGSKKTAVYRAQFLLESVANLRKNLRSMGSDLLVSMDKPEDIIPKLTTVTSASDVIVQGEVTWEEIQVESKVERAIKRGSPSTATLHRVFGGCSLYHPNDIPFRSDLQDIPNTFTVFKEKVEKRCTIRSLLPTVSMGRWPSPSLDTTTATAAATSAASGEDSILKATCNFDFLPTLSQLSFSEKEIAMATDQLDSRGVMRFTGGEDAAKRRIEEWMFRDDRLKEYFEIRNGMLGEGYSSKLSPWLAAGCISPRWIYHEVKRYEQERQISNKSTYWLIFELIWRDFFRYLCAKYGNKVFFEGGAIDKRVHWRTDNDWIERWKQGLTGIPLVDANMRELLYTGWMSNRGRQNVASYLVLDLGIDWRIGADHFESLLLDHDVCSNYGNWNAAAGLTGGRVNKFNLTKQSKDYDINGDYIRHWLPELRHIPAPMIFEPWKLSVSDQERYQVKIGRDYPSPLQPFSPSSAPSPSSSPASVPSTSGDYRKKGDHVRPTSSVNPIAESSQRSNTAHSNTRPSSSGGSQQRKFGRVQHL